MAPRSPPKRVTRARAAATKEDILSGPARKPSASKVQKSTATKKTRAPKNDPQTEAVEDEQSASVPSETPASRRATKPGTLAAAPRRRIKVTPLNPPAAEQAAPTEKSAPKTKKVATRRKASAKEEEQPEGPSSEASAEPAKTHSRSSKTTKGTEKASEKATEAATTRSRPKRTTTKAPSETAKPAKTVKTAEPARATRLTRTRAASNALLPSEPLEEKPKAKVTKKVTFEEPRDEDKENRPIAAQKAATKKAAPATGMRAKPVRKPSTATKASSTTTTASGARRGQVNKEKSPLRVLTPKKITQVNKTATTDVSDNDDDDGAGADDDDDDDDDDDNDELCGAKTPVRDLSQSPRRNPVLAAALSPVQRLDFSQPLVPRSPVKPIECVMMSPARRPPSPEKEVMGGSALKESSPRKGDLSSILPATSQIRTAHTASVSLARSHLLQSPKRVQLDASAFCLSSMKPKQSPFKTSLLGSPARRLMSPKKTSPSPATGVPAETATKDSPGTPENITVTSHFRNSASPARHGRVYRMSDEELADEIANEMDFDQSVLCVNSPLKIPKQALFDPSKEETQMTVHDDAGHADQGQMQNVQPVVEEMIHDSEVILAADPADIRVVLPKDDHQGVMDEMIHDSAAIGAASPSQIEISISVHDDGEEAGGDDSSKQQESSALSEQGPSSSTKTPTITETKFRSVQTPGEESEDELSGEKTPIRGPRAFWPGITGDHTRSRMSTGIPSSANRNIGFTPLAAQMSRWQASSSDKKSARQMLETRPLFSPIAAGHIDGEVVTTRPSTPGPRTPRSALSSMKRQSVAPRESLVPPALATPDKPSFFEDQMAGFEAQETDQAAAGIPLSLEQSNEGIATAQPCVKGESEDASSEAGGDTAALDSDKDDGLTTDLVKFTKPSNTAMVDFEQLAKEAQEMHEESQMLEDSEEYGDENIAPLEDMDVTEMITHTSTQEHFSEFPPREALNETVEQEPEAQEAVHSPTNEAATTVASISPPPQASSPRPELDISTPMQQDLSKPRIINTVISKVPLRPEGQASPLKIPRKRAHSLSNAAQPSPVKRHALTPVFKYETESANPSPDRRIRSAAPSPAVTTPGQTSFAIDDFGDSTLDSISLPGEEMMDFEVGNPELAPSSVKSTKTVQSIAATPSRTPLRQLGLGILSGTVIYVDVHTSEGADASGVYIDLLSQMGAKCVKEWRWNPRASLNAEDASAPNKVGITHVVYKDGRKRTLEKVRDAMGEVLCVGVRWVLDCEREQKWLDEAPYIVDHAILPRGGSRRRKSMEPSRLSNINGTVSAKAGRRTSSAEFLTNAMREDLINTPVSTLRSVSAGAPAANDDYNGGDDTEISSTYNSPTTTMNVKHLGAAGFETPPELKNWDPATSATPMVLKTPAQPNFRGHGGHGQDHAAVGLKSAPPKQLGQKLFGGGSEEGSGVRNDKNAKFRLDVGGSRRTTMGWLPRVRSPLGK